MAKSNGDGTQRKRSVKSSTPKTGQPRTPAVPGGPEIVAGKSDGESRSASVTTMRPRLSAEELKEAIRRRAYELFCQRGQQGGSPEEDWRRAEQEILSQYGQRTA